MAQWGWPRGGTIQSRNSILCAITVTQNSFAIGATFKNPNRVGHLIHVCKEREPSHWSHVHIIQIAFTIGSSVVKSYFGHWSFDIEFSFAKFNIGAEFVKFKSHLPLDPRL